MASLWSNFSLKNQSGSGSYEALVEVYSKENFSQKKLQYAIK